MGDEIDDVRVGLAMRLALDVSGEAAGVVGDALVSLEPGGRGRDQPRAESGRAARHRVPLQDDAIRARLVRRQRGAEPRRAAADDEHGHDAFEGDALRRQHAAHAASTSAMASATVAMRLTALQRGDGGVVQRGREGGAAIAQHDRLEIAHMRVAHGRGDAAIGDDAGDVAAC